jgi:hypothetical protein
MLWKNAEHSSVGRNWGHAPSLVEGIPARITLPVAAKDIEAWELDECGQRKTKITVESDASGHAVVVIGPQLRTIWYEMAIKRCDGRVGVGKRCHAYPPHFQPFDAATSIPGMSAADN